MKNLVIFTGSGISAESGLETYRDSDGLWKDFNLLDVATPEGWLKDPDFVQEFYNIQRLKVRSSKPNLAHIALVALEEFYNVAIITQNVDDLHERAGSKDVLHLHGEINKAQSVLDSTLIYPIKGSKLTVDDKCIHGEMLRPNLVWFGEPVVNLFHAKILCRSADIFAVIGTSLEVMPAASLIEEVQNRAVKYLIDQDPFINLEGFIKITKKATEGVNVMARELIFRT
jgi:NAD-dependent deacetylase